MKKILVTLLVVTSMTFALAAAAMANSVYVDGLVSGKCDTGDSEKNDFKSYTLGTNLNYDKLLFNLEYSKDTIKSDDPDVDDSKSDTINFKAGYTLFGGEQSSLALTAGYYQNKFDVDSDEQYSGVVLGLSAASSLGEKALLEGSAGYSINGKNKYTESGNDVKADSDILLLQVKYSYFFTNNFGLGIGYKLTRYKITEGDDNGDKITFSGPTVGLTYKF
jgi:hypothetical protein